MQTLLSHFYQFAKDNLGFDKDAKITFAVDEENSKNPLGTTAHYNPDNMEVTVYTSGRHPKDILRSVAHELVHHRQNCQGKMDEPRATGPGYAQKDMHLRALEEEAYLEGNMCFRDWEDGYKAKQEVGTIYESVIKTYTKEKLKMSTKEEMRTIVREAVSRVLTQNKIQEMDYEDDAYMDDLEKEFPFLKDDPDMGGAAPADVQAAMDDEMPAEEEEMMAEGEPCPNGCNCNQKQEEVVAEDASDETFDMVDMIADALGHKNALEAVVQAMSQDDARSTLSYIIQQYDLGTYDDKIVKEKSTEKHDDDPALKGDQDELPDHLQKAIIDAEEDEKELEEGSGYQQGDEVMYNGEVATFLRQISQDGAVEIELPSGEIEQAWLDELSESQLEGIEDEIQSSDDRYGDMKHIIPGVRFTGDIETDVRAMEENEELADWLYGELGSGDVVTDSEGRVEYAGADVQDYLDTGDAELPDIAETQEDFYAQMRTDARTISEDWNKEARNKRSALLNERLMKAWKLG